jgi:hypothetical protein
MTPKLGQHFGTDQGLLVVRAPASTAYRLEKAMCCCRSTGRAESPVMRSGSCIVPAGEQVKLKVMRNRKAVELTAKVPPEEAAPARACCSRAPAPARPPHRLRRRQRHRRLRTTIRLTA